MSREKDILLSRTPPMNLLALDEEGMGRLVQQFGWPRYRTGQILRWLYQRRVKDIDQMTDLSHRRTNDTASLAAIPRGPGCTVLRSIDHTRKLLLTLIDGLTVETVLIPDEDRLTLCVSTQVGCTLDCGFCLTGTMGLKRNLKPYEIMEQVLTAQDRLDPGERITNLVFMGMGEPLANMEALSEAIRRLTNKLWGLGWSPRRITVSTAGLAARLKDVATTRRQSGHLAECHDGRTARQPDAGSQWYRLAQNIARRLPPLSFTADPTTHLRVRTASRGE